VTGPRRRIARLPLALAILASAVCAGSDGPADRSSSTTEAPAGFVNRVWQVTRPSSIPPGGLYVFLEEGTLVMASSRSTPTFGRWTYTNGELTMIEDGIPYRTEILSLTAGEFRIRSHNPGEPVDVTLVPATLPVP
jgi:hypothetical protein